MSAALASKFRSLHEQDSVLILPNAWDAASALLQQSCGAKAIGTSSAALCWSLGYPDGSALPVAELIDATRRISRCLTVPLTVDIEDGYSPMPDEVADLAVAIREAGAVGINIEDGSGSSALLAEKIASIRRRVGPDDLFINARTDVYLRSLAKSQEAVSMVVSRVLQYASAGASGLFVPGLTSLQDASHISSASRLPLNLMALPGLPSIESLRSSGVRRVSAGPALFLAAFRKVTDDTNALLQGDMAAMFANRLQFAEVNALFGQQR